MENFNLHRLEMLKELAQIHHLELGADYLSRCPVASSFLSKVQEFASASELAVFAYASLMWKPSFEPKFIAKGRLHGFSRRPCIYSTTYRGTRARPGLVAGLDTGGSVTGLVQGFSRRSQPEMILRLFDREMFQGVYYPKLVNVRLLDEPVRSVRCLTFIANPLSPAYAGRLGMAEAQRTIAGATGRMGPCREYWEETLTKLNQHGIRWRTSPV